VGGKGDTMSCFRCRDPLSDNTRGAFVVAGSSSKRFCMSCWKFWCVIQDDAWRKFIDGESDKKEE